MKILQKKTLLLLGVLALNPFAAAGSEFIDDMPQLEPDPERPGAMTWIKPGVDRAAYTRVMIEPVTLFISPESKYKGLKADELKALSDGFVKAFTTALEPQVPVVNQKGPGVAYLRAALTNVKLEKKKHGLLSYTPIGLVVTAAEAVAGANITLKDAELEVEVLDSASGERLGVLTDKAPSTGNEKLSWDSIDKTLSYYAERYKLRMHTAQ